MKFTCSLLCNMSTVPISPTHSRYPSSYGQTRIHAPDDHSGGKPEGPASLSDDMVKRLQRRKQIAWIVSSVLLIILSIMIGVYLGWRYRVYDFNTSTEDPSQYNGRTVRSLC